MSGGRFNEPPYSFLETSGWPSVGLVREFWEGWFTQYPEEKKIALAARFRSPDAHQHLSALQELAMFACLKQFGLGFEVEPPQGELLLEFLTDEADGRQSFYVEATVSGYDKRKVGAEALEADLLDAINKIAAGRFLLEVEVERRGPSAPAGRPLRSALATWLASLDVDAVIREVEDGRRWPELHWERDGWDISIGAIPTVVPPISDDDGAVGMTLATFTPDQWVRLRTALDGKATKYGSLGKPLLVAINSTELASDRDLTTALLGDIVYILNNETRDLRRARKPNGVLGTGRKPRNIAMSAVMHGYFGALSFAASDRPITLTHHPFATHPLQRGLFPFAEERYFDLEADGNMVSIPATMSVAKFFGLPEGWPFFHQDPHRLSSTLV